MGDRESAPFGYPGETFPAGPETGRPGWEWRGEEPPVGSIVGDDEGHRFRRTSGAWVDEDAEWVGGRTWLGVLLTGYRLRIIRWESSS